MSVTQYIDSFQLSMRYLTLVLSHVLDIGYTFFSVSTRQFPSLGCLLLSQLGGPSSSSKKHTQSPVLGHHSFEETLLAKKTRHDTHRYTSSGFLLCRKCWFEDIGKQKNKRKICHRKTFRESIQLLAFPQRFNTNPNWDLCKLEAGGLKLGAKNLVFFSEAGKHVRFIHVHYEHVSCWNLLLLSVHTCWLNMYEIYWIMTFLKRFQGLIGKAKEIRNGNLSFSWLPRWYPFASVKIQGVLIHT